MDKQGLKIVTQNFIGTTEEWKSANPKLLKAVWAFEKTKDGNLLVKVGNGNDHWNDLKYFDCDNIAGLNQKFQEILQLEQEMKETVDAGKQAIEDEIAARKKADNELQDAVTDESLIRQNNINELWDAVKALVPEGLENIPELINQESQARQQAIADESRARQQTDQELQTAINNEISARQQADSLLNTELNQTNDYILNLQSAFNAWIGRGGFLDAYDFETETPAQEDITAYALSQITALSDYLQIWNGTKVTNLFDGHTWILTNTQDTDPPIFEWSDDGPAQIAPFGPNKSGVIKGADSETDGPGYIEATPDGKGKVIGIINMLYPKGSIFEQAPWDLGPEARGWGTEGLDWINWNKRAYAYGISKTAPTEQFITDWKKYRHDIWTLNTDNTVATNGIKKYSRPLGYICIKREVVHENIWTDPDKFEGEEITYNDSTWYIWQVIVPAGLFTCPDDTDYEGAGYKRAFISGGVQGDQIRNITGGFASAPLSNAMLKQPTGAFTYNTVDNNGVNDGSGGIRVVYNFTVSRVIPTGERNVPENVTNILWRHI